MLTKAKAKKTTLAAPQKKSLRPVKSNFAIVHSDIAWPLPVTEPKHHVTCQNLKSTERKS